MIEGQGLFQLAARSAATAALSRNSEAVHGHLHNAFERSAKPSRLEALTVDANTTIRAMFQAAWDKVHQDENLVSDDMLKRLETASKSDNKEIAAERLRQAKAKLRLLRLQAQMAAASGDPKQLRRIAQQAAEAAREVAGAARGLAEGIAASAVPSDGSASGAVPLAAATGEEADSPTAQTTQSDPLAGARQELRQLGDEVHAAIAQARGLIAFAAQMARARRHHDEDFYRGLQSDVTDAGHDVDAALNAAGRTLDSSQTGAVGGVSAIETTTTIIQVTTEVTVTANIVV